MENEEEGPGLDEEDETDDTLYVLLDETMARLEALPEPAPTEYGRDPELWGRFGILLSGIVSTLNDHSLDGLDVEEHIPVLEQQALSVVRRSWGIDGRGELLETIRYLSQAGYTERYRFYCEAESPEELMTGDEDEDDREGVIRAWAFAQHYKVRYTPAFMAGWDRSHSPLRSGLAIPAQAVPTYAQSKRNPAKHEQERKLSGQRGS